MKDKILSREYVMKNAMIFGENFGYGGDDYDSFIVEYDKDNNEHLFTGIIYDCYENGNLAGYYMVKSGIKDGEMVHFYPNGQVKEIKHLDKNTLEGKQKEFYENGILKLVEYRVLGRLVSFKKYDVQGNILEEKKESMESDLT
ncbi:toxin-antitoxin system YwqK family antitoxin [Lysinibacillus fusiformis]|uniref:toxin-antitoxin system YwqK family antitoxin n=1 Tax=Lysinibacillus fusiformis TaxID=28031 RepID=UPI0036E77495